jgi:N-acetylneuraminic acid mutarotase
MEYRSAPIDRDLATRREIGLFVERLEPRRLLSGTAAPAKPPAPAPSLLFIDAAGSGSHDSAGQKWFADAGFTGGIADARPFPVANTNDPALFYTRRYGPSFSYSLPLADGDYTLNLYFVETWFTHPGQRIFSVSAEGQPLLTNFDLLTQTAPKTALIKSFAVSVTDGRLDLAFSSTVNNAIISAISLVPASPAPAAITWVPAAPEPIVRYEAAGAAVNNKLYVFGGFDNTRPFPIDPITATTRSDMFDPASNTWSRIRDLPEPTTHMGEAVVGTTVWLAGGLVGNEPGVATNHVWEYDTLTNTYAPGPPLPAPRGAGTLALLGDQLHFFGGLQVRTIDQPEHWVLNLDNPKGWLPTAPIPDPRNHLASAVVDGRIYGIGGQHHWDESTTNDPEVDAYDPSTNTWTRVANLPVGHGHIAASTLVLNGHILTLGGAANGVEAVSDVFSYNPQLNLWSRLTPLPQPRRSPVAQLVGNEIVLTGGDPGTISGTATTWIGTLSGVLA